MQWLPNIISCPGFQTAQCVSLFPGHLQLAKAGILASAVPCSPTVWLLLGSSPSNPVNGGGWDLKNWHKCPTQILGFCYRFKDHPGLFETWYTSFHFHKCRFWVVHWQAHNEFCICTFSICSWGREEGGEESESVKLENWRTGEPSLKSRS